MVAFRPGIQIGHSTDPVENACIYLKEMTLSESGKGSENGGRRTNATGRKSNSYTHTS